MVKKKMSFNYCGLGALVGVILLGLLIVTPRVDSLANAEVAPLTQSARMKAETYVYSSLALALSDNVALEITPTAGGVFTTGEATLSITTNNTTGYSIYMSTGDNTSSLLPTNGLVDASIDPVDGSMNAGNYKTHLNEWGYALGEATADTSYTAVPKANGAPIITSEEMAADERYKLNFGVAVGPTLPSGTYYNSVLVSAVANPIAVHTLSGITYMQEMSPYVCDYSDVGETKQLVDIRDQKSYWVAKLADNKCWMTQNLALDLSTSETYTSTDTDLPKGVSYTPTSETNAVPLVGSQLSQAVTNQWSWNLGLIVLSRPLIDTNCNNQVSTADFGKVCAKSGVVDVSGAEWRPTFTAQMGDYNYNESTNTVSAVPNAEGETFIAVNTEDKTYDAHYLIGTYYQFSAATANTGKDVIKENENATGSICPRGWRMMKSGRQSDSRPSDAGDLYNLMLAYGYPYASEYETSSNVDSADYKNGNWWTGMIGRGKIADSNLVSPPNYMAFGGFAYPSNGYINSMGNSAHLWTSTALRDSSFLAMGSNFAASSITPAHFDSRSNGFTMRCIAR